MSTLSIVIPTRNGRALILRCLESLGDDAEAEVIVVDDASTDRTVEAVRERFPRVKVVELARLHGFSRAVNLGLDRAGGDILMILNSDTEILAGSLDQVREALRGSSRLGVVGAILSYPGGRPQWSGGQAPTLAWLLGLASGLPGLLARLPVYRRLRPVSGTASTGSEVDWVTGAAMAFRRAVWAEVGPFDQSFRLYCQDLDFCLRAKAAGWRVEILSGFTVLHHHGATIGQREDAVDRADPALLWLDLVHWARKDRGEARARSVAWALRTGARLRLCGRRLRRVVRRGAAGDVWERDTRSYRKALDTLKRYPAA